MALTRLQIRNDLLSYASIDDPTKTPALVRSRILNDINAALQDIYTWGPSFLKEKSFSFALSAPRAISGKTFSQSSTVMSGGTSISEDMIGCTLRIATETEDNEIVDTTTLQNPFQGTTTTDGSGTVYGDCVIFPEEVASIIGPVWLNNKYKLQALRGRNELLGFASNQRMDIGVPRFYWIESYGFQQRLRIYPMPESSYTLRFDAQLKAPQLLAESLWPEVEPESANLITYQVLEGLDLSTGAAISEEDSILSAFGKLGKRVLDLWGRVISAGTGLSGGGDLSANRTFSVNFGSSAGTVCEGNDTRLSNARTPTTHASTHVTGGSDVIADAVASGNSGLMSGTDKTKLDNCREKLTANRTYYVATTGSDSNDGLSAGSPFLTIQKAVDTAADLDLGSYAVTIQLADGTYTSGSIYLKNLTGRGSVIIQGNSTTPSNVIVTTSSGVVTIYAYYCYGVWKLKDFQLQNGGTGGFCPSLGIIGTGAYVEINNLYFGANAAHQHIYIDLGGCLRTTGAYRIVGSATAHIGASRVSNAYLGNNITMADGLAFTTFASCSNCSYMLFNQSFLGTITSGSLTVGTWYRIGSATGGADFTGVGAANNNVGTEFQATGTTPTWGTGGANLFARPTGKRYDVTMNGVISAGGATKFPGNTSGTSSTGGQYA
ncbi:MAG: hypothetical protein ACOY3I_01375 [Verrucomicrobiota bacterium]